MPDHASVPLKFVMVTATLTLLTAVVANAQMVTLPAFARKKIELFRDQQIILKKKGNTLVQK